MAFNLLHLKARMSIDSLIRRWCARNRQVFAPGTNTVYTRVIWRAARFAPEYINNLTTEHLERYIAHCLDKEKLSRRTVHNHIAVLKSFCRWVSENYGLDNVAAKVKIIKFDPPHRRFISLKEYKKVLAVCSDDESKIVKMLYHTGLRASELQNLQLSNIHGRSIRFCGKGRKERTVPLNDTAYNCLHDKDGKPTINFLENFRTRNALYNICKRVSIRAGIPIASPHAYRRFFGNQLRTNKVDIYTISRLYGHKTVAQTEQYLSEPDLEGVTDVLD